jgi:hypothetical protein
MASVDAAAELRRAAARAEFERKAAEVAPPAPVAAPVPLRAVERPVAESTTPPAFAPAVAPVAASVAASAPAATTVPSRYASMGILDEADTGSMDLDAVLRRRRAAS